MPVQMKCPNCEAMWEEPRLMIRPREYAGLPVEGYRPQSRARIDQVNANKLLEEQCLRVLDRLAYDPNVDQAWLEAGRRSIETGWMAVNRAIFQPARAKLLPGDSDA